MPTRITKRISNARKLIKYELEDLFDKLFDNHPDFNVRVFFHSSDWIILSPEYILNALTRNYIGRKSRGYKYALPKEYEKIKLQIGYENKLILVHKNYAKTQNKKYYKEVPIEIDTTNLNSIGKFQVKRLCR